MKPADQPSVGHAWLDGALDLHVHCAPSFFTRWGDGLDLARSCEQAGMAGVLLKAHEGSTVPAAAVLDRLLPSLQVLGGVVLNRYVGGVNPAAAEAALRLGGRCIWFPTMDADAHARAFGSTGAYPAQGGGIESSTGIRVLDDEGKLLRSAWDVLALAAEHDALVATGHLDGREIAALLAAARQSGVRRFLVQHPFFTVPGLDPDELEPLVEQGAVIELTYLNVSPQWRTSTVEQAAATLARLGGDAVVVSSDAGQAHNPSPPEALRSFAQALHEQGVVTTEVTKALRDTPLRLVER
ncbi:MAG: DUF6282 family protein [Thermoleophilaceae bacterium]